MLLSALLGEGELIEKILHLLVAVIALLPALTFHEWAHGYVAYKLGDETAKADGRLSLNPLDHLDPVGALMLLLVGYGWAKPVPVNTRSFKKPKRDFALCSIAGPIANFVIAFVSALLYVASFFLFLEYGADTGEFSITAEVVLLIFEYSMVLNIGLGLFNLIPIPPLDGSNVLMCVLPNRLAAKYSRIRFYTRYIFLGLIILNWAPYPLSQIGDLLFMPLHWLNGSINDLFIEIWINVLSPLFG
jgi:Zn-dependent protease